MKPIRSGRSTATAAGPAACSGPDLFVGDQEPVAGSSSNSPLARTAANFCLERPVHLPVEDAVALEDEPRRVAERSGLGLHTRPGDQPPTHTVLMFTNSRIPNGPSSRP